jgi:LysR family transcriptional regulator, cell division regulator
MDPKILPDLLVFLEVARAGSISKAARRLHTVQTNVSARIQKLESALDRQLMTRTSRGIALTAAGETLLPIAQRLTSLIDEISQVLPNPNDRRARPLRVGSLETFAATHLATLIGQTKAAVPGADFAITTGSSRSLMQMLHENALDVAFVSYPASTENLRTEFTFKEELVLLAPQKGTFDLDPKRLAAQGDLPLIVQRQACSYSERFLSYVRKNGLQVQRIVEAGSIETLLGLVEQGLGIAVVPRSLIARSQRAIRTIALTPLGSERWISIYLISNRAELNSNLRRFVEHCRKRFSGQNPAALHS